MLSVTGPDLASCSLSPVVLLSSFSILLDKRAVWDAYTALRPSARVSIRVPLCWIGLDDTNVATFQSLS